MQSVHNQVYFYTLLVLQTYGCYDQSTHTEIMVVFCFGTCALSKDYCHTTTVYLVADNIKSLHSFSDLIAAKIHLPVFSWAAIACIIDLLRVEYIASELSQRPLLDRHFMLLEPIYWNRKRPSSHDPTIPPITHRALCWPPPHVCVCGSVPGVTLSLYINY